MQLDKCRVIFYKICVKNLCLSYSNLLQTYKLVCPTVRRIGLGLVFTLKIIPRVLTIH